ncbi:MAG: 2-hydroxyacyl-CoA dehydratase [Sedimentisphaerales bacterium]|nr:2-hydroxyacyl-CoA dehydratase [Sedimentisphaerales bacterium]
METTQHIIARCKKLISQPEYRNEYLIRIKEKYLGIIGYFSNYIPEEIIAAAGFYPLRIIGCYEPSKPSPHSLYIPVCSFARDMYSAASSGGLSYLSQVVFPNSCDSMRVFAQMWEHAVNFPPACVLLHPINDNSNAIQYFAEVIERFAGKLHQDGGNLITQTRLKETIDTYNQTRRLLRRLYDIRKINDTFLAGSDAVALMTAGLIMARDEYNQILSQIVNQGPREIHKDRKLKRIMIMGPLMDNYGFLSKIEEFGGYIVYDNITNGSRYCDLDVEIEGNLYENIARRYLTSGPSPTLNSDKEISDQSFQALIDDLDLDGIIFINQKFCEPHVHKYLAEADILKQMNINVLMLEIEHGRVEVDERDMLRIESFLEIAGRS